MVEWSVLRWRNHNILRDEHFLQQKIEIEHTLSRKVIRGGFWVFALRITQQVFSLVRLIILARILSPNDFGLMGIALVTMATLEIFSRTGFQAALIQKKEDIRCYLNSAWTVLILRGFILFTILYFIAPYAAIFFNVPDAKPIIQIIGFSLLFQEFTNIGIIYFQKELEFNKQFLYQLSGTLADFFVAVSAAIILRSIWALVFGMLAGNFVKCVLSYIIISYKPRLSLDFGKAKELFSFGKWILGSSILVFLLTQGDDIFVGKLLGATALGFYQIAYRISNIPATEITHVVSQVTFPAYSKLQDDLIKLKEAYLRVLQVIAFLSLPIAGLIFVLAPDFTRIFLGEKWMPMVPSIQVLVWWGVIRGLVGAISPVFLSIGSPRIVTKLQAVQTMLLFILLYPLTVNGGILGASLAVFFSALVMFFIRNYILIKTISCKTWEFYKLILFPLSFTMISIITIIFLKLLFMNLVNIYYLLLFIGIFVLTLVLSSFIADRLLNYGIRAVIRESLNSLKY